MEHRNVFGMHAVLADADTLQRMYTDYRAGFDPVKNIEGFSANFVVQPIPKSATTVAKTNGIGNTWGVDNTKAYVCEYFMTSWRHLTNINIDWLITCSWSNAADDKVVTDWASDLLEKIHASNIAAGKGFDFMYQGDSNDRQKPFSGLPAANLAKLKTIRKKYDPTLVFTNLLSGGYKLD